MQEESQRRTRSAHDRSCIFIFWCHLLGLQPFSRCCCFSFFWLSSAPLHFSFSRSRSRPIFRLKDVPAPPPWLILHRATKRYLRNMITPLKWTNYSPLTTFQTLFYWSIQPNKTLWRWQKGMPSFLHIFSKPRVYMVPAITPLWHLNFIEQDFKICRQYIKGIYSFQMGGESAVGRDLSGTDWHVYPFFFWKPEWTSVALLFFIFFIHKPRP